MGIWLLEIFCLKNKKKGYTYSINFRRRTHEIVVEDYEIKIADFGLSKTAKSKISQT